MKNAPVNLKEKLSRFSEQWTPKIVARMNDSHFKLAKIQGEFVWHSHEDTDEVFLVITGRMTLHFRDGEIMLSEGELCVVPKGVEHRPVAETECHILLVEQAGTVNTGAATGELTAPNDAWI